MNRRDGQPWTFRDYAVVVVLVGVNLLILATGARAANRPCPRACQILQRQVTSPWICPLVPGGPVVVRRADCFVTRWPEPTL